jgi:hypothetical protein
MTRTDPLEPGKTADDEEEAVQEGLEDRPIARFVHEHPGMAIAGGIALGVLAAGLLPKRNREYVARKSSALADAVSAAGIALYREALDRSENASDELRKIAVKIRPDAGKPEASGTAAPPDETGSSESFDLAGALSDLIRYLRKGSHN